MIRTDMAMEAREMAGSGRLEGVTSREERVEDIAITRVEILNEEGARQLNQQVGTYITVESPALADRDATAAERTAKVLAKQLEGLLGDKSGLTLVVGLGNWHMTPDALGPKVVDRLLVTRHIKEYAASYFDRRMGVVAAISPGVLGITGIETVELIRGAVDRLKPARVICIDSLASRRSQRITTSFQLSDAGIHPGAGVGNAQNRLDRESLGVPVIAIGVPMVVDAATLIYDAAQMMAEELSRRQVEEELIQNTVGKVLYEKLGSMIVTPKEIDLLVTDAANVIADALNFTLHDLPQEDLEQYLY